MEKKHVKEHIKDLTEKVNRAVDKYNEMYQDEESMANDVLDYAEDVMKFQSRLITALLNTERNLTGFLKEIEQFETDMLTNDEVWDTDDGLPKITKEFYDRWIELQYKRNKLLGNDLNKARTYEELFKTGQELKETLNLSDADVYKILRKN